MDQRHCKNCIFNFMIMFPSGKKEGKGYFKKRNVNTRKFCLSAC